MDASSLYPINLPMHHCGNLSGSFFSHPLAAMVWKRFRATPAYKDVCWFGVEATLLNATTVNITVYDMLNSTYGGIGDTLLTIHEVPLTRDEIAFAAPVILSHINAAAIKIYEERQANIRRLGIEIVRKEVFGV